MRLQWELQRGNFALHRSGPEGMPGEGRQTRA
jgi:hypothetical protein